MANKELVRFIKKARARGFDDYQIRAPLIEKGWPIGEVELAFASLKPNIEFKNKITIYLNNEVLKVLEKRADKNKFTISEQIEDILRRSSINAIGVKNDNEKLDDMLVGLFSRKVRKK
jgi:hypothetical protein